MVSSAVFNTAEAAPKSDKAIIRMDGMVYFQSDFSKLANSMTWWSCAHGSRIDSPILSIWDSVGLSRDWWKKAWVKNISTAKIDENLESLTRYLKVIHFYRLQGFLASPYQSKSKDKCQNLWSKDIEQAVTEFNNFNELLLQKSKSDPNAPLLGVPIDRILSTIKHEYFN